jgi:hypothetical protein
VLCFAEKKQIKGRCTMRVLAFLASLAALVAFVGQGGAMGIALFWREQADKIVYAQTAATFALMAFFAIAFVGLLIFAVTPRRRSAE